MKKNVFSPHKGIHLQYIKNTRRHDMPVQHYHDSYEIYFLLDGERYMFCENTCFKLQRGSVAIVAPFELHCGESRDSDFYERYALNFGAASFSDMLSQSELHLLMEKLHSRVYTLSDSETAFFARLFETAYAYAKGGGFLNDRLLAAAVLQIAAYAAKKSDDDSVASPGQSIPRFVVDAIKHINTNYGKILTVEEVAAAVNVSYGYLCHAFKEYTGGTVLNYLHNVRLIKAHGMLADTSMPVGAVAEATGFGAAANLTRVFKREYGMTPMLFRKEFGHCGG